jgi:drug/metabolite transporter (DMT)-like permease
VEKAGHDTTLDCRDARSPDRPYLFRAPGIAARVTALLALAAAVFVGGADFLGGLTSRRMNGIRVALLVATAGLPMALVVSLIGGYDHVSRADVTWSILAGVAVSVGIGCFYLAMGRGLISVVAPVAAVTGAAIPVVYALIRGERPGPVALVGLGIAFVAVAVVSLAPSEEHPDAGVDGTVIVLSIVSGALFGLFYIAFSRISDDAGLWPVTIERTATVVVLLLLTLTLTRGPAGNVRAVLPAIFLVALLEVAATVPLLLALQRGPVTVASVVASLYPVTTVLLASIVLRERLSRLQYAGVVCALVSVGLVSSG